MREEMTDMDERRSQPRSRVDQNGLITVDEHTSMACLIHDISAGGVRITMPDAKVVPTTFVLMATYLGDHVCRVVWRTDEMIGAMFV
jgi:hypothetical protein